MTTLQKLEAIFEDYMIPVTAQLTAEICDLVEQSGPTQNDDNPHDPFAEIARCLDLVTLQDIRSSQLFQRHGADYGYMLVKREIEGKEVQFTLYSYINGNK